MTDNESAIYRPGRNPSLRTFVRGRTAVMILLLTCASACVGEIDYGLDVTEDGVARPGVAPQPTTDTGGMEEEYQPEVAKPEWAPRPSIVARTSPDAGTMDTADEPDTHSDPPPPAASASGPTFGSASQFASIDDMLAYLRRGRTGFDDHIRYKGLAWEGETHTEVTFPIWFASNNDRRARAQAEAERLAGGGEFRGIRIRGEGSGHQGQFLPFWVDGLNTANWMISFREGDYTENDWHDFPLNWGNIPAKFAFHYHDFGGDGPVIRTLGVGAAAQGSDTYWVLQFGP